MCTLIIETSNLGEILDRLTVYKINDFVILSPELVSLITHLNGYTTEFEC